MWATLVQLSCLSVTHRADVKLVAYSLRPFIFGSFLSL
jgi:hypothetical protein